MPKEVWPRAILHWSQNCFVLTKQNLVLKLSTKHGTIMIGTKMHVDDHWYQSLTVDSAIPVFVPFKWWCSLLLAYFSLPKKLFGPFNGPYLPLKIYIFISTKDNIPSQRKSWASYPSYFLECLKYQHKDNLVDNLPWLLNLLFFLTS